MTFRECRQRRCCPNAPSSVSLQLPAGDNFGGEFYLGVFDQCLLETLDELKSGETIQLVPMLDPQS